MQGAMLLRVATALACLVLAAGEIDLSRHGPTAQLSGPPVPLLATLGAPHAKFFDENNLFSPEDSATFKVVEDAPAVDLHFLDSTNLRGFTGQDMIQLGPYAVESRIGLITSCNSPICKRVDGILGFGFQPGLEGSSLFTTLIRPEREDWGIKQPADFKPMPPRFAFTASENAGELQLGGFDPESVDGGREGMVHFPMRFMDYAVSVASIKYGKGEQAVELLQFRDEDEASKMAYLAKFDSGTSCILMPNTTLDGKLTTSPFNALLDEQLKGRAASLYYTLKDVDGNDHEVEMPFEECVEPTGQWMILGDPWFRKFVVLHDISDPVHPTMGLGIRKPEYKVGENIDDDYLEAFAGTSTEIDENPSGEESHEEPQVEGGQKRSHAHQLKAVEASKVTGKVAANREKARTDGRGSLAMLSEAMESLAGSVEKVKLASDRIVYTVTLGVGSPAQQKKAVFDTGSYMLGIWSKPATSAEPAWEDEHSAEAADSDGAPIVALQVGQQAWTDRDQGVLGWGMVFGSVSLMALVLLVAVKVIKRKERGPKGERSRLLGV